MCVLNWFSARWHTVQNRFLLTKLVSKTRKFNRANTRIQDTTNHVFVRFIPSSPIPIS
jgi:hypothetical protein